MAPFKDFLITKQFRNKKSLQHLVSVAMSYGVIMVWTCELTVYSSTSERARRVS